MWEVLTDIANFLAPGPAKATLGLRLVMLLMMGIAALLRYLL